MENIEKPVEVPEIPKEDAPRQKRRYNLYDKLGLSLRAVDMIIMGICGLLLLTLIIGIAIGGR